MKTQTILKNLVEKASMSDGEIADMVTVKVSQAQINRLRHGKSNNPSHNLVKAIEVLYYKIFPK